MADMLPHALSSITFPYGISTLMLPSDSLDALNMPMRRPNASVTPIRSYLVPASATCLLRGLLLLGLEGLLAVAPYHNNREEGADDGGEQDDQDHRDADGPDAGEEERVQNMVLVYEGLGVC